MHDDIKNITTLAKLEECYATELRSDVCFSEMSNETSLFFETYKPKVNTIENYKELTPEYQSYKKIRKDLELTFLEQINEIKLKIAYQEFFLRHERLQILMAPGALSSNEQTRYHTDQIFRLQQEMNALIFDSKEAWETYYKQQWEKDVALFQMNRLVPVPYVEQTKNKIIKAMNEGHPVYLVGHLGSGKTQIAIESAIDFSMHNKIQEELESVMNAWSKEHINSNDTEAFDEFKKEYLRISKYYQEALFQNDAKVMKSLQPLFISGSHSLTYEDMFVEKTLTLEQNFSQESFAEYLDETVMDYRRWIQEHETMIHHFSEEEQLQLHVQIWKSFSDLLVAKNNTFGTVVKKIEREVLIAIKEGRPVIIDELNTIAMQNLIALNDLLQRHAGQTAYITGVGPVYINPGFAFIGTGNLTTKNISYEGTNPLNPAFQSRFITIEYNYVPQNLVGTLQDQTTLEGNQLFRVILTSLAEKQGFLQFPDVEESLEALFRFAQLSRLTQDVFMGKLVEETAFGENVSLHESVLSIRNVMHVLNVWNLGESCTLSEALWHGFISSITNADDQNYILMQAVHFGFFSSEEGWHITDKRLGDGTTSYDEIRKEEIRYLRKNTQTLSSYDVISLLYDGKPSKSMLEDLLPEVKQLNETDLEILMHLNKRLQSLENTKFLLNYLDQQGDGSSEE